MMNVMPNLLIMTKSTNLRTLVSISNDHTLKSCMKGNFHVQFGIGGEKSDLLADHTRKTSTLEPTTLSSYYTNLRPIFFMSFSVSDRDMVLSPKTGCQTKLFASQSYHPGHIGLSIQSPILDGTNKAFVGIDRNGSCMIPLARGRTAYFSWLSPLPMLSHWRCFQRCSLDVSLFLTPDFCFLPASVSSALFSHVNFHEQ